MTASPLTDISLVQAQLAARITALCAPCGLFPVDPEPHDFTALSIRCEAVIGAVKGFLLQAVAQAAENEPGNEVRDAELAASIDAHLTDLSGDITGALEKIADRVREQHYAGRHCARADVQGEGRAMIASLEDRLDTIRHLKLDLTDTVDDPADNSTHRPELSVWAEFVEDRGAHVCLAMMALWAQPSRYVDLTPLEARQLAALLLKMADTVDSEVENANEAAYDRQQESLMEGGGPPALLEQLQAALKIKRGLR